jgi:hypothetical protein
MRKNYPGQRFGALAHWLEDANLTACRWLAAVIVVGMAIAIPSPCSAQTTLELGDDSSYGIFLNKGGSLSSIWSTVNGGLHENGSIQNLWGGPPTITGTTNSQAVAVQTTLSSGQAGTSSIGLNATFTATGSVSIFNLNNLVLNGGTMTLNGAANDRFIFNVNGPFSLTNVMMMLKNGIDSSHVVFVSDNFTITGSTVYGTFYNGARGGSTNLSYATVNGAVVAGNNGNVVTIGTTINANPFAAVPTVAAAPVPTVAGAPETPTIMTAGLAAFLILGSSGISYLRRKRAFRNTLIAH